MGGGVQDPDWVRGVRSLAGAGLMVVAGAVAFLSPRASRRPGCREGFVQRSFARISLTRRFALLAASLA